MKDEMYEIPKEKFEEIKAQDDVRTSVPSPTVGAQVPLMPILFDNDSRPGTWKAAEVGFGQFAARFVCWNCNGHFLIVPDDICKPEQTSDVLCPFCGAQATVQLLGFKIP